MKCYFQWAFTLISNKWDNFLLNFSQSRPLPKIPLNSIQWFFICLKSTWTFIYHKTYNSYNTKKRRYKLTTPPWINNADSTPFRPDLNSPVVFLWQKFLIWSRIMIDTLRRKARATWWLYLHTLHIQCPRTFSLQKKTYCQHIMPFVAKKITIRLSASIAFNIVNQSEYALGL